MGRPPVKQEIIDRIVELNAKGLSDQKIADDINGGLGKITRHTVGSYRRKLNLNDNTGQVTDKQKKQIREYNNQGLTDTDISRRMKIKQGAVSYHRRGMNLPDNSVMSDSDKAELTRLHGLGYSDGMIASELRVAVATVNRNRRGMGLETLEHKLTDDQKSEIQRLNREGHTYEEIGSRLIISSAAISRCAEELGLDTSGNDFRPAELKKLRRLNEKGYNDPMIAKELGRSVSAVKRNRRSLNLPDVSDSEISRADMARKKRYTALYDVGEGWSYQGLAFKSRAASLGWPENSLGEAVILWTLEQFGEQSEEQIRHQYSVKREAENWKQYAIGLSSFRNYMTTLKRQELALKTSIGRASPITYALTGKANAHLIAIREDLDPRRQRKKIDGDIAKSVLDSRFQDRTEYDDDFRDDYDDEAEADAIFG